MEHIITRGFIDDLFTFYFFKGIDDKTLIKNYPNIVDEMSVYGSSKSEIHENLRQKVLQCDSCYENYFYFLSEWNQSLNKYRTEDMSKPFLIDPLYLIH